MTTHTKYSPSGSAKFLECTISLEREAEYKDTSSSHADRGSVGHELGGEHLTNRTMTSEDDLGWVPKGHRTPVDQDMIDDIQEYINFVNEKEAELTVEGVKPVRFVEQSLNLSEVYNVGSFQQGTCDAGFLAPLLKKAVVIDLKYGRSEVEVEENSQLRLYGLGLLSESEWLGYDYSGWEIELWIYQPLVNNIACEKISYKELIEWRNSKVIPAINLIENGNTSANPGEKQCQWCRARFDCKERAEYYLKLVSEDFEDLTQIEPKTKKSKLTNEELSVILTKVKGFNAFIKDMGSSALSRVLQGQTIPRFKPVRSKKNRVFTDKNQVIETCRAMEIKEDKIFEKKLRSPAQIEKALGKLKKEIQEFIETPQGEIVLVPESDKRPPVEIDLSEGFENVE